MIMRRSNITRRQKSLANYQRARDVLEAICEIGRELLRHREAP
jgi:hypothetical protein